MLLSSLEDNIALWKGNMAFTVSVKWEEHLIDEGGMEKIKEDTRG